MCVYKACVHSMLTYGGRKLGDETRGISVAASHREENAENDLQSEVVMVESSVTALRVGVDDLEEHLRQKRLRWFGYVVKRDEEVEIKKLLELKIEG